MRWVEKREAKTAAEAAARAAELEAASHAASAARIAIDDPANVVACNRELIDGETLVAVYKQKRLVAEGYVGITDRRLIVCD